MLYLAVWLIVLVIIAGTILYLVTRQPSVPSNITTSNLKPEKRVITLTVEGWNIKCMEVDTFDNSTYNHIVSNWDSYIAEVQNNINKMYATRGARITSLHMGYSECDTTVIITFVVDNKVTSNSEITADFLWFLNAWNLDFIDDHFNETSHGLTWNGVLKDVPTTIMVNVPPQPAPYKAWGSPYGHCHGHIWWPK